ncbi:hypothetical protein [Mangrovivirga cuniculi]|uniref:Sulfatase n=1 Tax=Mangrovivirga cuniculi TaxID=2715131 RepID=A0A4D7JMV2_9BACT|nr:hypothetical protein [Mangrovivirga cuniculi]QCK13992.1 hypothetical protein DCC35_04105 [Mangrovivirga cuniculi]
MKQRFLYLLKVFGLFVFAGFLIRLVFLLFHFSEITRNAETTEVLMAFVHGLRMDLSIASYVVAIPIVLLIVGFLFTNRFQFYANRVILILFAVILSLMAAVDLKLFQFWGFRLDTAPYFS